MRKEVVNRIETIIKELWPTADVRHTLLKTKKNHKMAHDQKVKGQLCCDYLKKWDLFLLITSTFSIKMLSEIT